MVAPLPPVGRRTNHHYFFVPSAQRTVPACYAVVTNDFCAAGGDTYNVFMRAYNAGTGFDTGIHMDEAIVDYITQALDGKITAEAYGEPRGSLTIIK